MAMTLGTQDSGEELVADINTTPLVDVMLVLLIVFLIAIPVVIQSVPVELPRERNVPTQTRPENVVIAVDRDGRVFWNRQPVADERRLLELLKTTTLRTPQPEIHIRGDRNARYESVGRVVLACQRAGIRKVGFITQPAARAGEQ